MKTFIFTFILVALVFLPTEIVNAQAAGGFVTCNGPDCSACDFVSMINKIITWLFGVIFVIFAVLMMIAGFGLVTSGGNQSALESAKSKFQNAIIGIIIVMAAWLLVDTIVRSVVSEEQMEKPFVWSAVQCQVQN